MKKRRRIVYYDTPSFSFVAILLFYNTKVRIKSDKQKNVAKLLADRRFRKMA